MWRRGYGQLCTTAECCENLVQSLPMIAACRSSQKNGDCCIVSRAQHIAVMRPSDLFQRKRRVASPNGPGDLDVILSHTQCSQRIRQS